VTAVNVGSGSDQSLACKDLDWVTKFAGNRIDYDVDHAVIGSPADLGLYRIDHRNDSSKDIKFTLKGGKDVENTSEWKNTQKVGVKAAVEVSGKVGVPIFAEASAKASIEISGELTFEQDASMKVTDSWSWEEEITAAARRITRTSFSVSQNTLDVPYTIDGSFVYNSGATVAGTEQGMYAGASTHDLQIVNSELNLDGTPDLSAPVRVSSANADRTVALDR
jgi:hypothetical protein